MNADERKQRRLEQQRERRAADPAKVLAQSRAWQAANREKSRESSRRWRINNPEKAKEADRRNHEKNRDRRIESTRAWRAANLERSRGNSKKWALANPERVKENNRRWTLANPGKVVAYRLATRLKLYGVSHERWFAMLEKQSNACPVCLEKFGSQGCKPNIDHCHEIGWPRGILCGRCNTGLGHFRDNPDFLLRAAEYLKGKR